MTQKIKPGNFLQSSKFKSLVALVVLQIICLSVFRVIREDRNTVFGLIAEITFFKSGDSLTSLFPESRLSVRLLESEGAPEDQEEPESAEEGEEGTEGDVEAHHHHGGEEGEKHVSSQKLWFNIAMCFFLTCYAGIMSGLTVGFQGINMMDLEVTLNNPSSSAEDKENAAKILPILKKHHLLLVTLLLNNATAMESLPLFLDEICSFWTAIIISTTAVLVFGEILPMSFFTGPSQIPMAAKLTPLISGLIFVFYPIARPISMCLDWMFGEEHELRKYGIAELKEFLAMQVVEKKQENGEIKALTEEELKILISTLELRDTQVEEKMIEMSKVQAVSSKEITNAKFFENAAKNGFSRIIVYMNQDKNNILGIIVTKKLLTQLPSNDKTLRERSQEFGLEKPFFVAKDTNLLEMMRLFQENRGTIAIVVDQEAKKQLQVGEVWNRQNSVINFKGSTGVKVEGIITLKDVFREVVDRDFKDIDINQQIFQTNNNSVLNSLKTKNRYGANDRVVEGREEEEYTLADPLIGKAQGGMTELKNYKHQV